jgi:hypothetical protein
VGNEGLEFIGGKVTRESLSELIDVFRVFGWFSYDDSSYGFLLYYVYDFIVECNIMW